MSRYDDILSGAAPACHNSGMWVEAQIHEAGFEVKHIHATFASEPGSDKLSGETIITATDRITGEVYRLKVGDNETHPYHSAMALAKLCGVTIDPERRPPNEWIPDFKPRR